MKYLYGILALIVLSTGLKAQDQNIKIKGDFKKDHKKAVTLWLYDYNYLGALPIFESLLKEDPTNSYIKFALADCYLKHPTKKSEALPLLLEAKDSVDHDIANFKFEDYKTRMSPISLYKTLGMALRLNYQFDEAIESFQKYETLLGNYTTPEIKKDIAKEIKMCTTGKLLVKYPVEIEISSLGRVVNSKYPDYAPVLSADEKTLIFTSRRGKDKDLIDPFDFGFYEQIYITEKDKNGNWGEPKPLSNKVNTPGVHKATVSLSVDGQQLLIYSAAENPEGNIYYTRQEGNDWIEPIAFDAINSKYAEVDAAFNRDGSEIYFSSNRKGGYGGFDIYKIKKLPNGNWSEPMNLGPEINTEYDERAPFIHPDEVTLFFASNGHESMGGYDIFQTVQGENSKWMEPENVGYPINTTDNDVFYVTSVDGKRAYYASAKIDGVGDKDIYMLEIKKETKEEKQGALTVMSGEFSLGDANKTVPEDAQIIVTDNESGDLVGIFRPNKQTGKYLFILPPGKNYNITYEAAGYLFKSENLIVPKNSAYSNVQKEIKLVPIRANETIVLNNVFFDFDSPNLTKDSEVELLKLEKLLRINKDLNVEISGHTDSKGRKEYNQNLSEQRAQSVKNFLVSRGITKDRIVAKGYGASQPIARNTNEDGTDNPEGRQLNRRIELKVLSTDGSMDNVVKDINVPDDLKKNKK